MRRHRPVLGAMVVALCACTDDGRHVRSYDAGRCTTTATGDASVSVGLDDQQVTLTPDRTTAGRVAFVVRNEGSHQHSFRVARLGSTPPDVIGAIPAVRSDEVCATTVTLSPGTYQVYCDVDDHFAAGERRTLRVV